MAVVILASPKTCGQSAKASIGGDDDRGVFVELEWPCAKWSGPAEGCDQY